MLSIAALVEKFEIRLTMSSDMLMKFAIDFLVALNVALAHEHFTLKVSTGRPTSTPALDRPSPRTCLAGLNAQRATGELVLKAFVRLQSPMSRSL